MPPADIDRPRDRLDIEADVLVIGGGMAAAWAAISAARAGATVVLVEKGYLGTSGVTANGGPGHWWVAPQPDLRRQAIERRLTTSFGLANPDWMERVIATTWQTLPTLSQHYAFQTDENGNTHYNGLRGPEYMRALRRMTLEAGVRVLDQSPAIELLLHEDGSVAGAAGVRRLEDRPWRARAGAVVLATGGCAFRSGLLGSHTNTGDGYLMAAEAGAELSGMEFSSFYSVSPAWCSTRVAIFSFARYFDSDGRELAISPPGPHSDSMGELATALQKGRVSCELGDVPEAIRRQFPQVQPATSLPFVRKGIDMYADRFEITLFAEGTIRGIGGLRVIDAQCQTTVPGLFAAGDAATRENVAGATSGGGAQNSAWALSSGLWSGAGAAAVARRTGRRADARVRPAGGVALRPTGAAAGSVDAGAVIRAVQDETLPAEKFYFRSGATSAAALRRLDDLWTTLRSRERAEGRALVRSREAAAMLATARWCHTASLARPETRGMHRRLDAPAMDPALTHRLLVSGIDDIRVRADNAGRGAIRP